MSRRARRIIVMLFAATTVSAVGFAVYVSLDPDKYFFYWSEDRAKWVYHPGPVAFVICLMLAEAGLALAALIAPRPRRLWIRCFLALALLAAPAAIATVLVIHAPFYMLVHHTWVWLLIAVLTLVAAVSGLHKLRKRVFALKHSG